VGPRCIDPTSRSMTAEARRSSTRSPAMAALLVGALGVVFGDIGTSPIYTVQTVFNPGDPHPIAVSRESVYGVISLIFWSVTIVVTLLYVLLVMRADNDAKVGSWRSSR
jgi:KUP system potassium uptake protein